MDAINGADTAWVLVSCALVLLMTPGLALFYGGMVNSRNVLSTFMHSFIALGVMTVQWVVIGYSLAFAPDVGGGWLGGLDYVLLHGVATRPGKPTIVGAVAGKPVLGLPGNPVSAMVQFDMFGVPAIYRMQGVQKMPRRGLVWAQLSQNIASESGREDYIPARLDDGQEGLIATPVFGKSNLIYTLVNADGLIKIPLNKGGLLAGDWVEVRLF